MAKKKIITDREAALEAVKEGRWALTRCSDELRADREIVLAAMKQDASDVFYEVFDGLPPRLLAYASPDIRELLEPLPEAERIPALEAMIERDRLAAATASPGRASTRTARRM